MTQSISLLLQDLSQSSTEQSHDIARDAWIQTTSFEEIQQLLNGLIDLAQRGQVQQHPRLVGVLIQLIRWLRNPASSLATLEEDEDAVNRRIVLLYRHLGDQCDSRWMLLQWLATAAQPAMLRSLVELLSENSLPDDKAVALVFSPLFQNRTYDPGDLFPRLLDALDQPQLATSILDLGNFLVRENRVNTHPAADRRRTLEHLLRDLMYRLSQLEEEGGSAQAPEELSRLVGEAVALVVSLCDALALIGHRDSTAVLIQVLDLPHRRIRTEAAAALARFGEESGIEALLDLAREPVARLRVLAYAAELGLEDRLDPKYATDESRCESEVALQLAQPAYFGLPPTRMETIDHRQMYWPGCDEPVDCYLFRYFYELGDSLLSNIAIGGPISHTFAADLVDVSIDDIYAAFAGWDVEHEEIFEVQAEGLNDAQRLEVSRLVRRANDAGYDEVETVCLGQFFGRRFIVARARREAVEGLLTADPDQILWYPASGARPLGPHEVLCIYKGRQLLRSFPT
jgi:HEAT repeat protein